MYCKLRETVQSIDELGYELQISDCEEMQIEQQKKKRNNTFMLKSFRLGDNNKAKFYMKNSLKTSRIFLFLLFVIRLHICVYTVKKFSNLSISKEPLTIFSHLRSFFTFFLFSYFVCLSVCSLFISFIRMAVVFVRPHRTGVWIWLEESPLRILYVYIIHILVCINCEQILFKNAYDT